MMQKNKNNMMQKIIHFLLVVATFVLASCAMPNPEVWVDGPDMQIDGSMALQESGPRCRQYLSLGDYSSIEVSCAIGVEMSRRTGEPMIEADSSVLDLLECEVRGGVLHVGVRKDCKVRCRQAPMLYLPFRSLTEIDLSGASSFRCADEMITPSLNVECSGASEADLVVSVPDGELTIDLSGASSMMVESEVDELSADLSGASHFVAKGKVRKLDIDASGASEVDCSQLIAGYADVDVSGFSHADVHVEKSLVTDVSGASSLTNHGAATEQRVR